MNSSNVAKLANTICKPRNSPLFSRQKIQQHQRRIRHRARAAVSRSTSRPLLSRLWTFAWRITGDAFEAERLIRQACKRVLEDAKFSRSDTPLLYKMYALMWSYWKDGGRLRSKRGSPESACSARQGLGRPSANGRHQPLASWSLISDVIDALPEMPRIALILVAVEGLSYDQAAVVLDTTVERLVCHLVDARLSIGSAMKPARFNA
jgi:RNA polymerase sigma-70 factor, ECF subfamily